MIITSLISFGCISCSSDDEDPITEYEGVWRCTNPATYEKSTIVKEGNTLLITSSGEMTWTMTTNLRYNAMMKALGDDWAEITYNGKTYRAEMYVRNNYLTINVNGDVNLKEKDFPFDGVYENVPTKQTHK